MTRRNEIAIIGTGMGGLVQALALAQKNIAVTLVGPVPKLPKDDRTTAILMPGIDFLKALGVWTAVKDHATPLTTMELIDGDSPAIFDAAEIGRAAFGYNIANAALKKTLIAALQKHKLVRWQEQNAQSLSAAANGWEITLSDGATIACALLIGADGRHSPTREAAGIAVEEKNIGQSALVTMLQAKSPHHATTGEWFRKGGPLTLVPVGRDKFALVWCDDIGIMQEKAKAKPSMLEQELNAATKSRFGPLKIIAPLQLWPVEPMRAKAMVAANCALIGEAAHVLPPIGAQGFNVTLQDIMALTGVLAESRVLGLGPGNRTQLRRYEAMRLHDIRLRYHSVNALNALLQRDDFFARGLRRVSMAGMTRSEFVKKYVMQMGLGKMSALSPDSAGRT